MSDDDNRWATFISALPSAWVPVATAFNEAGGVVEVEVDDRGNWSIDLVYGLSDLRLLLRASPVAFTSRDFSQDWWLDAHLESEGGLLVSREGRALVSWSDHFAAGMNATLRVCSSDDSYGAAVAEASKCQQQSDEDGDDDDSGDHKADFDF